MLVLSILCIGIIVLIAYLIIRTNKNIPNLYHCGYPPESEYKSKNNNYFNVIQEFFLKHYISILDKYYNKKLTTAVSDEPKRTRIAFISVFGTACGISTYNVELVKELNKHANVKVFAEYASETEIIDPENSENIIRCWHRSEHPKTKLITEIIKFNPDIIHFSHEYGFFSKAYYFTNLISQLANRGFKIVSTMHSVYEHLDKSVQESCVENLIVHTEQAKQVLVAKGISSAKVHVIPHGTHFSQVQGKPELLGNLWNTWGTQMIYQPGFLFAYKGHLRMLNIIAKLKHKYPNIHYVIQASENPKSMSEHDKVFNEIIEQSQVLNIDHNITIHRGFASEKTLLNTIRTAKCVVLPYNNTPEHDVRATSGIARMVLTTHTPLVVTQVHLFDDLEGIVPRCSTDEELYDAIDNILSDNQSTNNQVKDRLNFMHQTAWPIIADKTLATYNKIIDRG